MRKVSLYKAAGNNPAENLSIERYLFEKKEKGEIYIYLWQNDNTIVIGRYQNAFEEINMNVVREEKITVVRRDTGGGAVYHDLGNLNYSFMVDSDSGELSFCNEILGDVLSTLGIKYSFEGRNDIFVAGCKVSGTASHEEGGKVLYHGTLLVNSNLQVMQSALTRSNKITESKAVKSKSRKVGNLAELVNGNLNVDAFISTFSNRLNLPIENIYGSNLRIKELVDSKYGDMKWIYGFQPTYNFKARKRFVSGDVCITAQIENGTIKSIQFSGDFFSTNDIHKLEEKIVGIDIMTELTNFLQENGNGYISGVSGMDLAGMFSDIIGS